MIHLTTNRLTQDTLDRQLLESLAHAQRPKTKAERQKPIYYALVLVSLFCQLVSFVLASCGVLFLLVTNFKSSTGWVLIALAVIALVIIEGFVFIMLKEFHAERLDDKKINKSTVLLLAVAFCFSTPLTYVGTPYAVSLFASGPKYIDLGKIGAKLSGVITSDSLATSLQIKEAKNMALDVHNKNSYKGKTSRSARSTVKAYTMQKLALEQKLIDNLAQGKKMLKEALYNAKVSNDIIKQKHGLFCASFGGWLALVTVGAMVVLFGVRWYCEGWKRLFVVEGNIKLEVKDKSPLTPKESKDKEPLTPKEVVKTKEPQEVNKIGFNPKDKDKEYKEGDILKGIAPRVDRVFIRKDNGTLKAYTRGGLNNLIRGSSQARKEYLETLKELLR
jgi:hypothetical protein